MATDRYVLDASALLCVLFREPGVERVEAVYRGAKISTVNHAEVVTRLVDKGEYDDEARADLAGLPLDIVPINRELADLAGTLRADTRAAGLSLGDRCCLALAKATGATALTADRAWARVSVGVSIEVLR